MEAVLVKTAAMLVVIGLWLGSIILSTRGSKKKTAVSDTSEQTTTTEAP